MTTRERTDPPRGRARGPGRASALALPLVFLGAIAIAALVLRAPPAGLFGAVLFVLFGGAIVWIVVSVLWPARAERTCPRCGEEALERIDPTETRGWVCRACQHRDETASVWLMAEEDDAPLEDIVLSRRNERPASGSTESPVDTVRIGD